MQNQFGGVEVLMFSVCAAVLGYLYGASGTRPTTFTFEEAVYHHARGLSDWNGGCRGNPREEDKTTGSMKNVEKNIEAYLVRLPAQLKKSNGYHPFRAEVEKHFELQVKLFDDLREWREAEEGVPLYCTDNGTDTDMVRHTDWLVEIGHVKLLPDRPAKPVSEAK